MFWCPASVNYILQPPLPILVMLLFEEQVCQNWVEVMVLLVVHVLEMEPTLALHTQPLLHNFATLVACEFFFSFFLSLAKHGNFSRNLSFFISPTENNNTQRCNYWQQLSLVFTWKPRPLSLFWAMGAF
jgi:hypothetical protein